MSDDAPSKSDIQAIFKRLRNFSANKVCFDCQAKNPTWASVTYGVFICIDCSAVHRGLGVHLSFVRSTQLDTNWTWVQLRHMQLGGNANASSFFTQHNCNTNDAQQKYNSRAAQLYRDKLKNAAIQAMRIHGTIIHLDAQTEEASPKTKPQEDFFSEQEKLQLVPNGDDLSDAGNYKLHQDKSDSNASTPRSSNGASGDGPNVAAALSSSPKDVQPIKSTIGVRKPQQKKSGLGSKKGGLGAQKVKTNFSEIEKEALMNDQLREQALKDAEETSKKNAELESKQLASMRLAYQDLSLQQDREAQRLKAKDPQKAEQMERLGMGIGIGARSGITHSVAGDMTTIQQEAPSGSDKSALLDRVFKDYFDDEMDMLSLDLSRYKDYSFDRPSKEKLLLYHLVKDKEPTKSSWERIGKEPSREESKSYSRNNATPEVLSSTSGDAVKKYGNAKAISSDTFFGDQDPDYERKTTLSRFEGSSSISSADFFGQSQQPQRSTFLQAPDLDDVKESFRTGVTKLAGKLSTAANDLVSSIQDRYGS